MAQTAGIPGTVLHFKAQMFLQNASLEDVVDIKVLARAIEELERIRHELATTLEHEKNLRKRLVYRKSLGVVDASILELKKLWFELIDQVGYGIAHTDGSLMWDMYGGGRNRSYAYASH